MSASSRFMVCPATLTWPVCCGLSAHCGQNWALATPAASSRIPLHRSNGNIGFILTSCLLTSPRKDRWALDPTDFSPVQGSRFGRGSGLYHEGSRNDEGPKAHYFGLCENWVRNLGPLVIPWRCYCAFTFWKKTSSCEWVWPEMGFKGFIGSVIVFRM